MVASRENFPLLAELLAEQQQLDTPVARFSTAHDALLQTARLNVPLHRAAPLLPQLIPLTAPSPGEHYAFEVDLDSCTGCKSCVSACHSLNGLDGNETWRDIGLLVGGDSAQPFTQTITTACHHCADPACLNGCPVLAYEKDPVTGVVVHLDDQCIGCSYCVLKCPYDVPKYSQRLGIVRKCDLCHTRLSAGEAPACAQACPTHAIRIVNVTVSRSANGSERLIDSPINAFLPGAPDPAYTQPTTRYLTQRLIPANVAAADAQTLRPQPSHWPLAVMLPLLGAAVGLSTLASLAPHFPTDFPFRATSVGNADLRSSTFAAHLKLAALLIGAAGLAASVLHLGQPLRAWRIFLGWRKSWLSREAMMFGAWFAAAIAAIFFDGLNATAATLGGLALACSAMVYIDTRRTFWRAAETFPRILGTAVLVPLALVTPSVAAVALLAKLAWEARSVFGPGVSARLQRGPLARAVAFRMALGLSAALLLVVTPGWIALVVLLAGELAERTLFFRAVDAPKMPGMPA